MTLPNRGGYRMCLRSRAPQVSADAGPTRELMSAIKRGRSPAQIQSIKQEVLEEEKDSAGPMQVEAPGHALTPLLRKLVALIANPGALLAALVEEFDGLPCAAGDYASIEAKAVAYQRRELEGLDAAWRVILDAVAADPTPAGPGSDSVHATMLKTTLYYWRVWEYVSAVCIDAVARVENDLAHPDAPQLDAQSDGQPSGDWPSILTKRRGSSISPSFEARTTSSLESPSSSAKRARLTRQSNEFMIGWFLAHKSNPYPSASERELISGRTGLTEQQVRNWFANMRKRHWKPNRPNGKKPRCLLDYVLRSQSS